MTFRKGLLVGLLSFLFGCASKPPFEKRAGVWHYRDTPVTDADPRTFTPLDKHYAKDANRVYYADTYRKGQEYFLVKHDRIVVIDGADPASFALLRSDYARDARAVYHEGVAFPVRDVASFTVLDYGFARDAVVGYYHQTQIPGSDGPTFAFIDSYYSRDKRRVYYSFIDTDSTPNRPIMRTDPIEGADVASFTALESRYAADARRGYYGGRPIVDLEGPLQLLGRGYARTGSKVFHDGVRLTDADAASFVVPDAISESSDAQDRLGGFYQGKRVAASRP